ncbi:MAG TPA: uroporphyrinogen-III synthase, partial [Gemmatimonadales bacterium]|nr:uroporphyrinogen-III synthase [Gemmatimonadales bacterium]
KGGAGGAGAGAIALPLAGRRIAVTRAREQADELVRELEARGAAVVCAPTIRIEVLRDLEPLRRALARLRDYRWVAFTSQNAVQVVFDALPGWGYSPTAFTATRIAAIGPATGHALTARGVRVAVIPDGYVAEALVAALASRSDLSGARILIPRAQEARDALPEGLRARGAKVDVIPVYRTVPELGEGPTLAREILAGRIDAVTLTSSSTVHAFVQAVGREVAVSGRYRAAVIGPITAGTAREYGLNVDIEAREYTTAGLVAALERFYSGAEG